MVEAGIGAVNMKSVAERAGVQRSTVYNHWTERIDLVLAAIERSAHQTLAEAETADRLTAEMVDTTEQRLDGCEPIRTIVRSLGRNLGKDWGVIAASLASTAEHDAELADAHRRFVQTARDNLSALIAEQIEAGILHRDIDADWAVRALIGPLYYERLVMHRSLSDAEIETHIDTTMAILADPAPSRS